MPLKTLPQALSHYCEILKPHVDSYRTVSLPRPILTPPLCRYVLCYIPCLSFMTNVIARSDYSK